MKHLERYLGSFKCYINDTIIINKFLRLTLSGIGDWPVTMDGVGGLMLPHPPFSHPSPCTPPHQCPHDHILLQQHLPGPSCPGPQLGSQTCYDL